MAPVPPEPSASPIGDPARRLAAAAAAARATVPSRAAGRGSSRSIPDRHARALFDANALDTDGRNWTYLPVGPFDGFEPYDAWLRQMAAGDDPLFFTVVDRATDRPVGVASYLRIDPAAGSIEVGHINFSPLAQRTRAATEAMFLMMRDAFALGYRRYEWKCDALNAPSRAAADRLGFTFEGIFRQAIDLQGPQPRHGVVLDRRSRVPGPRARVPGVARARPTSTPPGRQRRRLPDLDRATPAAR